MDESNPIVFHASPFLKVAMDLRGKIKRGEIAPGAAIPSVNEIMKTYGVANSTAQKAIRILKTEGLVTSRQGKGVFVTDNETKAVGRPDMDDDFSLTSAEIAADKIATLDDLLRDLFTHIEGLPKSEKIAIARKAGARLRLAKATMGEIVGTISAATISEPGEVLSF